MLKSLPRRLFFKYIFSIGGFGLASTFKIDRNEGLKIGKTKNFSFGPSEAHGACGSSYDCPGGGGECGSSYNCPGGGRDQSGQGHCGSSYNCPGGGGGCGSSYNCPGTGGKCGSSYNCPGGGGVCGSSYNCPGN